jgi:hypothetical protein
MKPILITVTNLDPTSQRYKDTERTRWKIDLFYGQNLEIFHFEG